MKKVRCYDCHKTYDYDQDPFCPHCGAFNQPPRARRTAVSLSDRLNGEVSKKHSSSHRVQKTNSTQIDDWMNEVEKRGTEKLKSIQSQINSNRTGSSKRGANHKKSDQPVSLSTTIRWFLIVFIGLQLLGGLFDYIW